MGSRVQPTRRACEKEFWRNGPQLSRPPANSTATPPLPPGPKRLFIFLVTMVLYSRPDKAGVLGSTQPLQMAAHLWMCLPGMQRPTCSGPENYTHDVLGNAAHLACSQSDATHCSFVHLLLSNASRFWPTCLNGCFLPPISRQCDKNIRSASMEISGSGRIFGWQQSICW